MCLQAAARHQCSFLVSLHVREFYRMGVCLDWLKGLQYIPQRLRNLNEINKLLAHRPWLITKEHIQVRTQTCIKHTLIQVHHPHMHILYLFKNTTFIHIRTQSNSHQTFLFPSTLELGEDRGAQLVFGRAGPCCGHISPFPCPGQLCVWQWHQPPGGHTKRQRLPGRLHQQLLYM